MRTRFSAPKISIEMKKNHYHITRTSFVVTAILFWVGMNASNFFSGDFKNPLLSAAIGFGAIVCGFFIDHKIKQLLFGAVFGAVLFLIGLIMSDANMGFLFAVWFVLPFLAELTSQVATEATISNRAQPMSYQPNIQIGADPMAQLASGQVPFALSSGNYDQFGDMPTITMPAQGYMPDQDQYAFGSSFSGQPGQFGQPADQPIYGLNGLSAQPSTSTFANGNYVPPVAPAPFPGSQQPAAPKDPGKTGSGVFRGLLHGGPRADKAGQSAPQTPAAPAPGFADFSYPGTQPGNKPPFTIDGPQPFFMQPSAAPQPAPEASLGNLIPYFRGLGGEAFEQWMSAEFKYWLQNRTQPHYQVATPLGQLLGQLNQMIASITHIPGVHVPSNPAVHEWITKIAGQKLAGYIFAAAAGEVVAKNIIKQAFERTQAS